jgi:hypothetical protein
LLLYQDGHPAGWRQVAPRPGFWRLFHTRWLGLEHPSATPASRPPHRPRAAGCLSAAAAGSPAVPGRVAAGLESSAMTKALPVHRMGLRIGARASGIAIRVN